MAAYNVQAKLISLNYYINEQPCIMELYHAQITVGGNYHRLHRVQSPVVIDF